ncbi:regulatory protein RecX [Croceicoccus sp. F390]|uniref:Regulatory protein RecX n=1 Tax=Croceicoccus esteveae TaxID=3075597 RepID=A0ABU2ZJN3_9SPHN|nr:regulatory protein RecX [Croceicoccus sp. F390]MDT0576820.1 regulatory protein RecX [Croceicoccus sp. F390]
MPVFIFNAAVMWHRLILMDRDQSRYSDRRKGARAAPPLTTARLEEMALAYVARFATTGRKLQDYCLRKIRERGWTAEEPPVDLDALVARFVANGWIDDEQFAKAKTSSLLRQGYGKRRIAAVLDAAGVAKDDRAAFAPSRMRAAALRLARKRRFGPFGKEGHPPEDRKTREKQLAAMLRAGHDLESARTIINASDVATAQQWVEQMDLAEADITEGDQECLRSWNEDD